MAGPRMTLTTQLVLRALLVDPAREMYGLEICAAAELPSGTIHPILARLEGIGWLESRWEDVDPREAGRPRRRFYRLSRDGVASSQIALARAEASATKLARLRPGLGLAGGAR
ncbi:helix-turn-helix transcriptional regulator [Amycolatopsis sp. NPDC026612]|uniref:PadR family transcriptional regulator n=1 Tax=Amycolatopsis sp. NPDC026612 TaxID=3155466 RepID=UPI0033F08C77